ncbi:MAG: GTPase Era [Burkholderiaceae bacterium]|nr:GTPase Era [Burkholderiaceae bacterium]
MPSAQDEGASGESFRCGYVAIVGRPNVGKSTLLNRLVGQKLTITSQRAQTTRHRIAGIVNRPGAQLVVLDSPGYQTRNRDPLNRVLNRTALATANDADVVVLVVDAAGWTDADARIAALIPAGRPCLLAINKVDAVRNRERAFAVVEAARRIRAFDDYVPISARSGHQVELLAELCARHLPEGVAMFDGEALTDRSERFLAGELIREKLFRLLGDELPYQSTVVIDQFEELPRLRRVFASIHVERDSHKPIVLGARGERIRRISTEARQDLEKLFGTPVYLELFVKVRSGWADDEQSLRAYGYE